MKRTIVSFGILFILVLASCDHVDDKNSNSIDTTEQEPDSVKSNDITHRQLLLSADSANQKITISADLIEPQLVPSPRMAEIFLSHSPNLQFLSSTKGQVLEQTQKQLVVQTPEPGKLRIIIFAADNTNELGSGQLATLQFTKTDNQKGIVEILQDSPIFAPSEANEGLIVGGPVEL